jgi:hypothetical protein
LKAVTGTPTKSAQLYNRVRRDILAGRLKPGQLLPTQRQLGTHHGVAEATASVALTTLAHEGLIVRTRGQGSFVSDDVTHGRGAIDFVRLAASAEHPHDPADNQYVDLFARLCHQMGRREVWHQLPVAALDHPSRIIDRFAPSQAVIALWTPGPLLSMLAERGIAVVAIPDPNSDALQAARYPTITWDRRGQARMAVDHLVEIGRRRIGYVYRQLINSRLDGFVEAVQHHGLRTPIESIVQSHDWYLSDVQARLVAMLSDPHGPDALCCDTDHIAAMVQSIVLRSGLRVPDDVAIIAADSGPDVIEAPASTTTIGVDHEAMCRRAIELIDSVTPGHDALIEPVVMPIHLTVRDSTQVKQPSTTAVSVT